MDKILELLIEYFRTEIEKIKKKNETENTNFGPFYILRIYKNIYIPLFFIFILGLFNTSNDILKEMAISSFYAIIVISLLFYISYVGYTDEENKGKNAKEKFKSLIEKKYNNKEITRDELYKDKEISEEFEEYKTDTNKIIRASLRKLVKEGFLKNEGNKYNIIKSTDSKS